MLAGRATTCRNEIKLQLIASLNVLSLSKVGKITISTFSSPPRLSYDVKCCVQERGEHMQSGISREFLSRWRMQKNFFCGNSKELFCGIS